MENLVFGNSGPLAIMVLCVHMQCVEYEMITLSESLILFWLLLLMCPIPLVFICLFVLEQKDFQKIRYLSILTDFCLKPEDPTAEKSHGFMIFLLPRKHNFWHICTQLKLISIASPWPVVSPLSSLLQEAGGSMLCEVPATWLATCVQQ